MDQGLARLQNEKQASFTILVRAVQADQVTSKSAPTRWGPQASGLSTV